MPRTASTPRKGTAGVKVTRTKGKLVKGSKAAKEWMENIRPVTLKKGSKAAKDHMAKLRAMRGKKKKTAKGRKTKRGGGDDHMNNTISSMNGTNINAEPFVPASTQSSTTAQGRKSRKSPKKKTAKSPKKSPKKKTAKRK